MSTAIAPLEHVRWPGSTIRVFASVLRRHVLVVEGEDVVDVVGAISHIDKLSGLKYVREVLEQGGMNAELLTYEPRAISRNLAESHIRLRRSCTSTDPLLHPSDRLGPS